MKKLLYLLIFNFNHTNSNNIKFFSNPNEIMIPSACDVYTFGKEYILNILFITSVLSIIIILFFQFLFEKYYHGKNNQIENKEDTKNIIIEYKENLITKFKSQEEKEKKLQILNEALQKTKNYTNFKEYDKIIEELIEVINNTDKNNLEKLPKIFQKFVDKYKKDKVNVFHVNNTDNIEYKTNKKFMDEIIIPILTIKKYLKYLFLDNKIEKYKDNGPAIILLEELMNRSLLDLTSLKNENTVEKLILEKLKKIINDKFDEIDFFNS